MEGRFITVEGGEGSGKSTFVKGLTELLTLNSIPVLLTREPGGSQEAEHIRSLIVQGDTHRFDSLEEVLLLNAARRHHIRTVIKPALEAGKWILCDRFFDSTLVYQGYAKHVDVSLLEYMHKVFCFGMKPDHTLVLDVSVSLGLARTANRGLDQDENRFELFGESFHSVVRNSFLDLSKTSSRYTVINTDTLSSSHAIEEGWSVLKNLFLEKFKK